MRAATRTDLRRLRQLRTPVRTPGDAWDQATPQPDPTSEPTAEEFAAWCEDPVTRWVAAAFFAAAELQKEAWTQITWGSQPGELDGDAMRGKFTEFRVRADAYMAFLETTREHHAKSIERHKDQGS